jgi:polyphosphate kinase
VQEIINLQLEDFGNIINTQVLPGLASNKIMLYYNLPIPDKYTSQIRELFFSRILAFIQPVFMDDSLHRDFFPENNKIYFFVLLKKEGKENLSHALINIPADKLPRFFKLETDNEEQPIVFLDDIIRDNLNCIFTGFTVHSCYSFKITRNSELFLDEENIREDLLKEMERKLVKREMGNPTRFLYENGMPLSVQNTLSGVDGIEAGRFIRRRKIS